MAVVSVGLAVFLVAGQVVIGISPEVMAKLQLAAEHAARGIRDPGAMRDACQRMDRLGEEIRRKHGVLDIGVPAIRELRDAE